MICCMLSKRSTRAAISEVVSTISSRREFGVFEGSDSFAHSCVLFDKLYILLVFWNAKSTTNSLLLTLLD